MKAQPRFRNDDVSYDTEITYFTQFCDIFKKYGFIQVHAVTLRVLCNYSYTFHGEYRVYEGYGRIAEMDNAAIRRLSEPYKVEKNTKLIEFLGHGNDEIARHGLYHTDYTQMSEAEQYEEMREGLVRLQALFPQKKVSWFVPPFNRRNHATHVVMDQIDVRLNSKPDSQYHSADRGLPAERRRPSEYQVRYDPSEVRAIVRKPGLRIVCAIPSFQSIPRMVYVFGQHSGSESTASSCGSAQRRTFDTGGNHRHISSRPV